MNKKDTDKWITAAVKVYDANTNQRENWSRFSDVEKTIAQLQNPFITTTESFWTLPSISLNISTEIDIFSDLDKDVYDEAKNKQMAIFIRKFKKAFYQMANDEQQDIVLPKLSHYIDEDKAHVIRLASTWDQGNAMLYFAFEVDEKDSSYGLIWNDKIRKNYESRSGNIFLNEHNEIIHEACDFIFRAFA